MAALQSVTYGFQREITGCHSSIDVRRVGLKLIVEDDFVVGSLQLMMVEGLTKFVDAYLGLLTMSKRTFSTALRQRALTAVQPALLPINLLTHDFIGFY